MICIKLEAVAKLLRRVNKERIRLPIYRSHIFFSRKNIYDKSYTEIATALVMQSLS